MRVVCAWQPLNLLRGRYLCPLLIWGSQKSRKRMANGHKGRAQAMANNSGVQPNYSRKAAIKSRCVAEAAAHRAEDAARITHYWACWKAKLLQDLQNEGLQAGRRCMVLSPSIKTPKPLHLLK